MLAMLTLDLKIVNWDLLEMQILRPYPRLDLLNQVVGLGPNNLIFVFVFLLNILFIYLSARERVHEQWREREAGFLLSEESDAGLIPGSWDQD